MACPLPSPTPPHGRQRDTAGVSASKQFPRLTKESANFVLLPDYLLVVLVFLRGCFLTFEKRRQCGHQAFYKHHHPRSKWLPNPIRISHYRIIASADAGLTGAGHHQAAPQGTGRRKGSQARPAAACTLTPAHGAAGCGCAEPAQLGSSSASGLPEAAPTHLPIWGI